jgi:hypothetical protein
MQETIRRNQQIAEQRRVGQEPQAIARTIFPDMNAKLAYDRLRTCQNRYPAQIQAAQLGHLVQEVADSLQDIRPQKRGRPRGKLMQKTLNRIESAGQYAELGRSQRAVAQLLFPDLPKETAYDRTRDFFSKHRSEIDEVRRRLRSLRQGETSGPTTPTKAASKEPSQIPSDL